MRRIVLDTNIFVSILIRPGQALSALVEHLDSPSCNMLYSAETLTELVDILHRKKFTKYTTPGEIAVFVEWVLATGELVTVAPSAIRSRDPKDDKFLDLAVAGGADYLITGDADLLVLGRVGATTIVTPAAFLAAISH